jgi:hypothetical protein
MILAQPVPVLSPEEHEYVNKTLQVQENIKNAVTELETIKKKYGKTEREKKILQALKKQEMILDELQQDLEENTKRKLDEKIEEFHTEYLKYTRGIADESDLRSKYREVQFYAGNFPIPVDYLISEALALSKYFFLNLKNKFNLFEFEFQKAPLEGNKFHRGACHLPLEL